MKAEELINQHLSTIKDFEQRIERIKKILEIFPDLEYFTGFCFSKLANSQVTNFEYLPNYDYSVCGIKFFCKTDYGNVLSIPSTFDIVKEHPVDNDVGYYLIPDKDWKDQLRAHNIPEGMIGKLENYFNELKEKAKSVFEKQLELI